MKKLRIGLLSVCLASLLCFAFTTTFKVNASDANVSSFVYTGTTTSAVTGTEEYANLSSTSGVSYSSFDKQGVVWEYSKGESITYSQTIDLSDNVVSADRKSIASAIEAYGLWASSIDVNKSIWGANVYETQLTFRFADANNEANYFD